jgi:DNA-directed RNA polymerase subunit N (RpoN/RPB10)
MMIIPIRCFSCGGVIAHKWEEFSELTAAGVEMADALDKVGLMRYCCRRMYVGHIDLIYEIAPFSTSIQ